MKSKKFKSKDDNRFEDGFQLSKKRVKEDKARKAQRNLKNAMRSKNLDIDAIMSYDD